MSVCNIKFVVYEVKLRFFDEFRDFSSSQGEQVTKKFDIPASERWPQGGIVREAQGAQRFPARWLRRLRAFNQSVGRSCASLSAIAGRAPDAARKIAVGAPGIAILEKVIWL